ncbi:MAG: Tfp pilus assembly protein FimT/FimU, partial [Polyangiales bacterium]
RQRRRHSVVPVLASSPTSTHRAKRGQADVRVEQRGLTVLHRRKAQREGMTLIEVMLVIVIGALLVVGASTGLGAIARTNMRAAAMTISSASRFAYHRAVTHGKTVRIALDFDANTIGIEEAQGQVILADPDADDDVDEEVDDDGSRDPWAAAQASLDDTMQANLGRASFSTVGNEERETGADGEPVVTVTPIDRFRPRPLDGVELNLLITPHEREARVDGKGYIYFFPSGRTETAIVQLTNEDEVIYSVQIDALTGRAEIFSYARDESDLEALEIRDPG